MFWDIAIVVGIGFTQVALTSYGHHVSINEARLRNAIVIAIVGAAGIGLTVSGAIRSGTSQQRLEADIAELKKGQQTVERSVLLR